MHTKLPLFFMFVENDYFFLQSEMYLGGFGKASHSNFACKTIVFITSCCVVIKNPFRICLPCKIALQCD